MTHVSLSKIKYHYYQLIGAMVSLRKLLVHDRMSSMTAITIITSICRASSSEEILEFNFEVFHLNKSNSLLFLQITPKFNGLK